jgi:hypothetical protein
MGNDIVVVISDEELAVTVEPTPIVHEVVIQGVGAQGPKGDQGIPGVAAPSLNVMAWSRRGYQYVSFGDQKFYVDHPGYDLGIRATLTLPATGSDFIVAMRQNNVIIGRATILDGEETSGYITLAPGTVSAGDYFMLDIEQVGANDPGYTLNVSLWMRVTP